MSTSASVGFRAQGVMKAANVNFTGLDTFPAGTAPQVVADGQLLIGSTVFPNIRISTLTAGPGISITNGSGAITINNTAVAGAINITPDAGVNITNTTFTFNAVVVAAGATPIRTFGSAGNALALQLQTSQATGVSTAAANGVSHFNNTMFTVDANGFVSLIGGSGAIDSIQVDAFTAPGTNPVVPNGAGLMIVTGAATAASGFPVRTDSLAVNSYTIEVQRASQQVASAAANAGLASFNSVNFTVDANGWVSLVGTVATSYPTDAGTAIPAAGVLNIVGGPGITTSGVGNTVTINSVVFTDRAAPATVTSDSGSYSTATIALTLPAAPLQGELCEFVVTTAATVLTVTANAGQTIRIGNIASSVAGTATSLSAIGDALVLRFQAATLTWWATSSVGNWLLA